MNVLPGILNTIILAGAIQGIIIVFLLFFSPNNRKPNRILAILILLMSLAGFELYFDYYTGWVYLNRIISRIHLFIPMVVVMPMGPLIYFYIRSTLDPAFTITKKYHRHFYSAIIDIVPQLTAVIFFTGVYANWFPRNPEPWGIFIDEYNKYADIPRWCSLTIYVWLAAKYLTEWKANNHFANQQSARIQWLQTFIRAFMVMQIIWFIYLVPYILPQTSNWLLNTLSWYPIYIPLSILIYWLGIKGYIVGLVSQREENRKTPPGREVTQQAVSGLTKAMLQDKLYLDPLLSIQQLSEHTGIPGKTISAVLNQHIGKGFNEYVNEFRIEEVKRKLVQPGLAHLTITGIGLECGFNSQATFQRIFKQQTGMSPSEFRKSTLNS